MPPLFVSRRLVAERANPSVARFASPGIDTLRSSRHRSFTVRARRRPTHQPWLRYLSSGLDYPGCEARRVARRVECVECVARSRSRSRTRWSKNRRVASVVLWHSIDASKYSERMCKFDPRQIPRVKTRRTKWFSTCPNTSRVGRKKPLEEARRKELEDSRTRIRLSEARVEKTDKMVRH